MARSATQVNLEPALLRFAERLSQDIGGTHALLFGSHAREDARPDSDYDLIVVSDRFSEVDPMRRAVGLRSIWYEVGGDAPMDLICLTAQEFLEAQQRVGLVASVLPQAIDLLDT